MDNELKKLLSYFKMTNEPHGKKSDELITEFVKNLDTQEKKQIEEIVLYFRKKNTRYYKNYNIEQFIKTYIFNKNKGRNVGTLTNYIQHYKTQYNI